MLILYAVAPIIVLLAISALFSAAETSLTAVSRGRMHQMEQEGSLAAVHAASRGVPRLINILCDYLLLDAFQADTRDVSAQSVHALLQHLEFETQFWPEAIPPAGLPVAQALESPTLLRAQTEILHLAVASLACKMRSLEKNRARQEDHSPLVERLALMEQQLNTLQREITLLKKTVPAWAETVQTPPPATPASTDTERLGRGPTGTLTAAPEPPVKASA